MKLTIAFIVIFYTGIYASVCHDRFLETLNYGYNESIRLDSANWDIQSSGGDRNIYKYSQNGKISENIRITINKLDTIKFQTISSDSLVWIVGGVLSKNWIKYGLNGSYTTNYDDGYGSIHSDSISYSGDSIFVRNVEKYNNSQVITSTRGGYYANNEYYHNYVVDADVYNLMGTSNNCLKSL